MLSLKKKSKKEINRGHFPLDLKVGLTSEQVEQRKSDGLVNKTPKHVTKSYFRIIYENVFNFFNILLIITTIFMIIAKAELINFVFFGIFILNMGIGLYQDIRARRLVDKLKVVSSIKLNVLRDGEMKQISSNEVVLSDIIEIKQGSQLVCDGKIVDGFVEMNESLLTGEAKLISKKNDDDVYSGSFVVAGTALYRVEHIGKENYAEKLQLNAGKFKRVKSNILKSIKVIFRVIGFFIVALGTALIIKNWADLKSMANSTWNSAVLSVTGSVVAMMPIGMYLLTSTTLAIGVIRLSKRNMLTQDMYCIETLARADILCLDKTGTLTNGDLNVLKVVSTSDTSEKDLAKIIKTLVDATKDDNATARAIKKAFSELNNFDSYSAIPFSSERKYSAVMLEDGRSIIMGAREFIPHNNPKVDEMCKEYEKDGMRVLILTQYSHVISKDEKLSESNVLGFLVLQDRIREDAPENIKWFKDNGVDVRIITGDNPESAAEIARRAGIDGADKFISLDGMSLEEVKAIASEYKIFGRVTPEQKAALIEALKEAGHSVAMTGDGVNDILALRVADCSIAMASGSDAAKNVAHLVSLDSSFGSLPDVVREGRRVINNIQRTASNFLIKTVFAIVITTFALIALSKYPFTPKNMQIWELLPIGIGSLFLSLQPNDEQIKSGFLTNILFRVMPAALTQIGFVIFFFLFYKDTELAATLSILSFTIFSFVIFIRVCLPFDVYRCFLTIGLTFIGVVVLVADYFAGTLGINYSLVHDGSLVALILALLVGLVFYFGLSFGASKLHKYIDKKREEKIQ